ncbi:hypothetical protein [Halalkalibacter urbisdiaboli]|uniref:hypothetical protein n=1 Tax=Halalkalibacter urbisdiaboli TaxID=1960589 RepID=UPI000B44D8E4|nr:hypothetical protein [Halalkalibacter urbisdiaboli]
MTKEQIIQELKQKNMEDMIELIEDAEEGHLEELELVESIGLVYDRELNTALIALLEELGVNMIYLTDEE